MTRSLAFTPLASTDIEEAYQWYEAQRPGLGDEFRAALNVIGQLLSRFPEMGPEVHRDIRRQVVTSLFNGHELDYRALATITDVVRG